MNRSSPMGAQLPQAGGRGLRSRDEPEGGQNHSRANGSIALLDPVLYYVFFRRYDSK
ncbi:hypothetical protein Vsou_06750 [Vulcanisaeta souniana JCM 11219]|uniref:Uncharacterized protein n=2 Tax=Vulcanisaeta souniana JCM 11219 TaxID=1293586 RepID=A0ABM8BKX2_9CREN|nr:hypothetical protein [Vulcanisaeta souniana]BDR91582.1 hypothetical protein Vsou_06750 [Vulcanisaeta souniana JCM 11219]